MIKSQNCGTPSSRSWPKRQHICVSMYRINWN